MTHISAAAVGSSPSARSPREAGQRHALPERFISERTESTARRPGDGTAISVHLRARGVHVAPESTPPSIRGSSPSARSPHPPLPPGRRRVRFISERAESTSLRWKPLRLRTVHLRARGVHLPHEGQRPGAAGSSPSARSPQGEHMPILGDHRFISERAESTPALGPGWVRGAVHLRARGVHSRKCSGATRLTGSSPSARSPLRSHARRGTRRRFISERAESTR